MAEGSGLLRLPGILKRAGNLEFSACFCVRTWLALVAD
jgi:hypothetical protein